MFDSQPFERDKHVYRCDEFSELLKDAVRFFHGTPVCKFPPAERFVGAGVYALYYIGKSGLYAKFGQEINREEYRLPIYVGKAEPTGWRQNGEEGLEGQFTVLRELITKTIRLRLGDFRVRFVEERYCPIYRNVYNSLRKMYRPIWNRVMHRRLNRHALENASVRIMIKRYLESV